MQISEDWVDGRIRRLLLTEPAPGMQARVISSCRSRLYDASCDRRRKAVRLAVLWTLVNVALGLAALSAHQKHVQLRSTLYGG